MAEVTAAYRYVDPGLNYLFTNNYDLSIRILPDGFSYTVFDTLKDKFISIEEFASPSSPNLLHAFGSAEYIHWLDQVINQCYLLQEKFNKVTILAGGNKYTLMPAPLFDPAHLQKYLSFNHPLSGNDAVFYDLIKSPESCLIYAIPASLSGWIAENYPGTRSFHICGSLIRNFQMQFRGGNPITRILANIQADTLDIIIFKGAEFQFCNSFRYTTQTDLLYYLLFVLEQLKINTEESPLFLSGSIENDSGLIKLLNTYIRHVEPIPEVQDKKLSPVFDNAPLYRYYDLMNVSLCG
jgi:hypothetical protein